MESAHEYKMRTDKNYQKFLQEQAEKLKTMCPCCGRQMDYTTDQPAKMTMIVGARQSGKTILLDKMKQQEIARRIQRDDRNK